MLLIEVTHTRSGHKRQVTKGQHINPVLTRAWPGGGFDTPFRFFASCSCLFSAHFVKISDPGHSWSGHQVTSSDLTWHLRKTLNIRHSYTERPITLKLAAIDIGTRIYETYISEFWYRWNKVRSILRPLHYKSMGEKWKAPLLHENHSKHSKTWCYR